MVHILSPRENVANDNTFQYKSSDHAIVDSDSEIDTKKYSLANRCLLVSN